MKKTLKTVLALALCVLMAVSLVACGGDGGGDTTDSDGLVTYTSDTGISLKMPTGYAEKRTEGVTVYFEGSDSLFTATRVSFDLLASAGIEGDLTLEEYADIVATANGITDYGFEKNEYGDLYITYTRNISGNNFFYYTVVKKGADAFWVCSFACFAEDEAKFLDSFMSWATTIVV